MRSDSGSKQHSVRQLWLGKLFKYHKILEPLRSLKGIAVYLHIRGDLHVPYMDELKAVLSVPETGVGGTAKKTREIEVAEYSRRQEQDRSGFYAFTKKMAD